SGFGASGSFGKSGDDGGDTNGEGSGFVRFDGFRGNSGGGISANFTNGNSIAKRTWSDINGDGLSDLITIDSNNNAQVSLNNGTGVNSSYSVINLPLFFSKSSGISGGLGVNKWQGSLEAGLSLTTSWNSTNNTMIDINGDGLMDLVSADNSIGVRLNAGNHFVDFGNWASNYNLKRESASIGASINVGASFALIWRIFGIPFKIPAINVNGTPLSTSTNRTYKSITDFDGDGYPDLMEEVDPSTVKVYSSRIRRTDMLKSVTNPLGGKFTVDYKVQKIDYNNPNPKWAMTGLVIEDGYNKVNDGRDVYKKEFVYEDGKYDRRERDFYGYETVKVVEYNLDENNKPTTVYRTSISKYHNNSYFLNGLLKEAYVTKGDDETKIYSRTVNNYEIKALDITNNKLLPSSNLPSNYDVGGSEGRRSAAVVLTKTENYLYELAPTPLLTTGVSMIYDDKGRVITYIDSGNITNPNDDYSSQITYHNDPSLTNKNIITIPKSIKVYVGTNVVRERSTLVNTTNGNITQVNAKIDATNNAVTNLDYDTYGNLRNIIYPPNYVGNSMTYNYTYDTENNKYVVQINDAFGYSSSAIYDARFDKVIETTDLTGNKMQYQYDSFGRTTIVRGPKEIAANKPYTLKFQYYPRFINASGISGVTATNFVPVALTKHYDLQHPTNDIETYTFIDGLGRPIQIKKDISINTGTTVSPKFIEAMSLSGKVFYDEFGRAINQYHPYYEAKTTANNFVLNEYAIVYKSTSEYDALDRPIKSIDPEGNISTMEYTIDNDVSSTLAIKTKSVVQQNASQQVITESYKDTNGRVISAKNIGPNGDIWTKFNYNAIGELLDYTDAENIATSYKYDMLGRKKEIKHPDNGKTIYEYDNASNMLKLQTANLANDQSIPINDRFVKYEYDFNRLSKVNYPVTASGNNISNVRYVYGASGAGNDTGRLIEEYDATGYQKFKYGVMGEMIQNDRVIVGPNIPTRSFKTIYEYDSWNRIISLKYPDNETVNYVYDLGGNLNQMAGTVNNQEYKYIERIDYDHYEQRTYLKYGNKTETFYNYTPSLRRLNNLNVKTAASQDLFNNKYDYDKVGNVTSIVNSALPVANAMGGTYNHNFVYDNLNRLVGAEGKFTGKKPSIDYAANYTLNMQYNNTHGIAKKQQTHVKNNVVYQPNTYENNYGYFGGTHKVKSIINATTQAEDDYEYDLNGNLTKKTSTIDGTRQFLWDESNRMRIVQDQSTMQHYIYDGSGERVLKAKTNIATVYQNGTPVTPSTVTFTGYTTYASPYIVIDPNGVYSKHYYAGSQRIVSRIGESAISIFNSSDSTPCPTCKEDTGTNDEKTIRQTQIEDLQQRLDKAKLGKAIFKKFEPISYDVVLKTMSEDDESKAAAAATPPPMYFYHPDHLGTSTFLTDANGNAYQFFLNLPFGETMAEQKGASYYKSPFKFNGKELDEETGLYYYGARYYDPKSSIWLSVDPLAEQGPEISPYIYCNQNPLNLTDPDGRWPDLPSWKSIKTSFNNMCNKFERDCRRNSREIASAPIVKLYNKVLQKTADVLNKNNTYKKEKNETRHNNIGDSMTIKDGTGGEKTDGKQDGKTTDMTGLIDASPSPNLPSSNLGNKIELATSPTELYEAGQKIVEGTKEVIKEVSKKANSKAEKTNQSEYIFTRFDSNNSNNNIQVRNSKYDVEQKKKND
ncbi:MAG: RHS repeat-associated core domain-containing protein, partial [Flavobacterium sp.]|uniref:RHS repeat-associated core domain-containing protein n=1 Tax=Flavobacterium sp. TaxID=239 RepID=UPI003263E84A